MGWLKWFLQYELHFSFLLSCCMKHNVSLKLYWNAIDFYLLTTPGLLYWTSSKTEWPNYGIYDVVRIWTFLWHLITDNASKNKICLIKTDIKSYSTTFTFNLIWIHFENNFVGNTCSKTGGRKTSSVSLRIINVISPYCWQSESSNGIKK